MSSSTAIFACSDLAKTLAYYEDILGFSRRWTWGEPPSFGAASMGGVSIMFALQPELAHRIQGHEHWIDVEDPDEVYELHRSRNANIISKIADRPWGFREYVVEDLNGYHIRFAGPLSTVAKPSTSLPEGITFERRKPTAEEFAAVTSSENAYKKAVAELLPTTWAGVVARNEEGATVGLLRINQDAPGWFSIWDVAVIPECQGQHIGSTMMMQALQMIREASPGANIYLFTGKHGFYEKLGFGQQSVSMQRL